MFVFSQGNSLKKYSTPRVEGALWVVFQVGRVHCHSVLILITLRADLLIMVSRVQSGDKKSARKRRIFLPGTDYER
jgi:hypothetical protein